MQRLGASAAGVRVSDELRRKLLKRRRRQALFAAVELLERRQLLSTTLHIATGDKSATYIDPLGDTVSVAVSVGNLASGDFTFATSGSGDQLEELSGGTQATSRQCRQGVRHVARAGDEQKRI